MSGHAGHFFLISNRKREMNENRSIQSKAAGGFIFLMITMGIFLFGSAGTLNYWQGWVWLLVFFGSSGLITIFLMKRDPALLERRLRGGPGGEKEMVQKKIIRVARFIFLGILVIPGLDQRFAWSHVPYWLVIFSDLMAATGFYIIYLVFRENSFTSAVIEVAKDQRVISTGPYQMVRHPMYSGALLMIVFAPLGLASYWGLVCIPPFIAIIVWRLLEEEKFLVASLPGYSEFRKKTIYRLIPGIW
jgi:protein-S-isoprenylcysteine O-methyltransferase Ste14